MPGSRGRRVLAHLRPAAAITVLALVVCGLAFPAAITGVAQALFPYQANGELVHYGGRAAGSELIAQGFPGPSFFHARNDSASGVDPDIAVQDAYAQAPRISAATGIPEAAIREIVDQRTDWLSTVLGEPYVNVLDLNIALMQAYPHAYPGLG